MLLGVLWVGGALATYEFVFMLTHRFPEAGNCKAHALAGQLAANFPSANIPEIITSYYEADFDVNDPTKAISFGTSGHRGTSLDATYTHKHIEALAQSLVTCRKAWNINGPIFVGYDTHALSLGAFKTTLSVLLANGVEVIVQNNCENCPTPVISREIVRYNFKSAGSGAAPNEGNRLADGIIITPSHNPPHDGGFKYNPYHGGPAAPVFTSLIEKTANEILKNNNQDVKKLSFTEALKSPNLHFKDMRLEYVDDLASTIDMKKIADSKLRILVNAQGGTSSPVWELIQSKYQLNLEIINTKSDPTFSFMPIDYDGNIRMDCMSPYTMWPLVDRRDEYDFGIANDPDSDRHGVVTKNGLLSSYRYLPVIIDYLLKTRDFNKTNGCNGIKVGKTIGAGMLLDKVIKRHDATVYETPIGYKWFAEGLYREELVFGCEESAGVSFLDRKGKAFVTDKDGFTAGLIGAEIMASSGKDLDTLYDEVIERFGNAFYDRDDVLITKEQKKAFMNLTEKSVDATEIAGSKVVKVLTHAEGNNAPIGGIKVLLENAFFSARPSGTENLYKIYYESFVSKEHAAKVHNEAVKIIAKATGLQG